MVEKSPSIFLDNPLIMLPENNYDCISVSLVGTFGILKLKESWVFIGSEISFENLFVVSPASISSFRFVGKNLEIFISKNEFIVLILFERFRHSGYWRGVLDNFTLLNTDFVFVAQSILSKKIKISCIGVVTPFSALVDCLVH